MSRKDKEKYAIGIFVSSIIGSLLYLLFTNWVFLAAGLASGIFFLLQLLRARRTDSGSGKSMSAQEDKEIIHRNR